MKTMTTTRTTTTTTTDSTLVDLINTWHFVRYDVAVVVDVVAIDFDYDCQTVMRSDMNDVDDDMALNASSRC